MAEKLFDCSQCPAYCCSYPTIPVTMRDLKRIARRFGVTVEVAEKRFTKRSAKGERIMRHRKDHIFPTTCQFLDGEKRACTIYEHRPEICRAFPTGHCGYYDFMMWERENQRDDAYFPIVT